MYSLREYLESTYRVPGHPTPPRMKRHTLYLAATLLLATLASCSTDVFYSEYAQVDEHGWLPSDSVCFDVQVDDTLHPYHFLVEVRNTADYPYSNTFLFLGTTFPDGSVSRDTLELPLAAPDGQWYGKRTGRYIDTRCHFRRNARFPMPGTYRFAFTHGMRDSAITDLRNIGLRIEHTKTR